MTYTNLNTNKFQGYTGALAVPAELFASMTGGCRGIN